MRALALLIVIALLALPAAAHAQTQDDGNNAFGPLPAAPTPNPEPIVVQQESDSGDDVSRTLLFVIAGGLLLTFLVIGRVIFRDARRHVPADSRAQTSALREEGPHRHAKHAKQRARAKGKAQKAARRRNR
jgi:hypothetical protein